MPIGTAIGAGLGLAGSIGGALITSDASRRASNAQQSALQTAMAKLQPFMDAGRSALDPLTKLLTPGSNMTEVLSQIPGFQFAQDWGQKAVRNQGTTLGLGGNVLSAGANYATGLAQNSYGSIVNALQNLANMGANAGSGVASIAGNVGNAAASGILGSANALSSGLSNGANSVGNAFLLNGLTSKLSPGASGNGIYSGPGSAGPNGSTWQPDPMGGYSPGYAEGGRPTPGEPAIVGEEGPEVFVPDQPGTIIPNPKTRRRTLDENSLLSSMLALIASHSLPRNVLAR